MILALIISLFAIMALTLPFKFDSYLNQTYLKLLKELENNEFDKSYNSFQRLMKFSFTFKYLWFEKINWNEVSQQFVLNFEHIQWNDRSFQKQLVFILKHSEDWDLTIRVIGKVLLLHKKIDLFIQFYNLIINENLKGNRTEITFPLFLFEHLNTPYYKSKMDDFYKLIFSIFTWKPFENYCRDFEKDFFEKYCVNNPEVKKLHTKNIIKHF